MEYALTALFHMDIEGAGEFVSTKELSSLYSLPEERLGKILQKLTRSGILESSQGKKGGYRLVKPMNELMLGEIMEALDGPVKTAHDGEDHTLCTGFCSCYVKGAVEEIQQNLLKFVYSVSPKEMLSKEMEKSI